MPGRCTFTATSRPSWVRRAMHLRDARRRHRFGIEVREERLERRAEIVLEDRADLLPRSGRHAVLELRQFLGPDRREQIDPRREQLPDLQEGAAVPQAGVDEAPRVARVQGFELRLRRPRRHEGGGDRVGAIARGDRSEQPARLRPRGGRASASERDRSPNAGPRVAIAWHRRARSRRARRSVRRCRADPRRSPRCPTRGRPGSRTSCAMRRVAVPAIRATRRKRAQSQTRGAFASSERPTKPRYRARARSRNARRRRAVQHDRVPRVDVRERSRRRRAAHRLRQRSALAPREHAGSSLRPPPAGALGWTASRTASATRRASRPTRLRQLDGIGHDLVDVGDDVVDELEGVLEDVANQMGHGETPPARFALQGRLEVLGHPRLDHAVLGPRLARRPAVCAAPARALPARSIIHGCLPSPRAASYVVIHSMTRADRAPAADRLGRRVG